MDIQLIMEKAKKDGVQLKQHPGYVRENQPVFTVLYPEYPEKDNKKQRDKYEEKCESIEALCLQLEDKGYNVENAIDYEECQYCNRIFPVCDHEVDGYTNDNLSICGACIESILSKQKHN